MNFLYVFLGGGLGSLSRYASSQFINNTFYGNFPFGTLSVNILGSLLIGFLYKIFEFYVIPMELRLLVITGFLGGYTTFSAYSLETVQLFSNGNYKQAILNIILNNMLCLIFVIIGIFISKTVFSK